MSPDECLVFEDSETGINAAKNANMKNIIAIGEHYERRDIIAHNCKLSQQSWLDEILVKFF